MFICFDYRCPECGHTEERFVKRDDMDFQTCREHAPEDGALFMDRLPAGTRTHFRFADKKLKR